MKTILKKYDHVGKETKPPDYCVIRAQKFWFCEQVPTME